MIKKEQISKSQLSRLMIVSRKALSDLDIENDKPESERKTVTQIPNLFVIYCQFAI
jgi:CRISPR-associated protein Csx10